MKTIALYKDFGLDDIGSLKKVEGIIDKISISSAEGVILDLSNCLIDYPATSRILDKVLFDLLKEKNVRKLEVVLDYILPPATLLNWLFLGSTYFHLEDSHELPINDLIEAIASELTLTKTKLRVVTKNTNGQAAEVINL